LTNINAIEAWQLQSNAASVLVAVLDDGVYEKHLDLGMQFWRNQKELNNGIDDDNNGYVDDLQGWDFIQNSNDMRVYGNHGTMVAGILTALPDDYAIVGISRNTQIMPLLICGNSGECYLDLLPKAIRYATDNGANIINISLGGRYTDTVDEAIRYAYSKGVVIVAAAGNLNNETNFGQDLSANPRSPVCNDNGQDMVLGVSAVDKENKMVNWAAYGNCVDVVAPGVGIMSTAMYSGLDHDQGSGTSFAAPMVTAQAALLKAKYPSMTNRQIIDSIKQTANHDSSYNGLLGSGLIDVYKSLSQPVFSAPQNGVSQVNSSTHPAGTVVLGKDKRTVYIIGNGEKRGFATPEEYNSHGFVFSDIVVANDFDLGLTDGAVVPFADGTLVLDASDGRTIYMIDNKTKRGFVSAEVFEQLGYTFSQAVLGKLEGYSLGTPIISSSEPHPAGAVVLDGSSHFKIFANGKKRIFSQEVLNSWHWDETRIVNANVGDKNLPEIAIMPFRDGTLIKTKNGGIYIVSNGDLRPFASMEVFNKLGYKTQNIVNISDSEFYFYKVGSVIN